MPRKGNRSWTEGEARAQLAALDRSGQSVEDYAKAGGFSTRRFSYWRGRLAGPQPAAGLRLVELSVRSAPPSAPIEVGFPTGHVVRVSSGSLTEVLRAVAALAC